MRVLLTGLLIAAVAAPGATSSPVSPHAALASDGARLDRHDTVLCSAAGPVLAGVRAIVWVLRRDDAVLDLWVAGTGGAARRIHVVGAEAIWLREPRLAA